MMERAESQQLTKEEYLSGLIKEAVGRTNFFSGLPEGQQGKFIASVRQVVMFAVAHCSLVALRDTPKMAFTECGAEELLEEEKQSLSAELIGVNRKRVGQTFRSAVHAVLSSYAGGFPSVKDRTKYQNRLRRIDDREILSGAKDHTIRRRKW